MFLWLYFDHKWLFILFVQVIKMIIYSMGLIQFKGNLFMFGLCEDCKLGLVLFLE